MQLAVDWKIVAWRSVSYLAMVLALAELLVGLYYASQGAERVYSGMIQTAVVTLIVGTPFVVHMMAQNERLTMLMQRLKKISSTDDMTGLLNRKQFLTEVTDRLAVNELGKSAGAFLFLDADHFKTLNDTYGHALGDRIIAFLGERIRSSVRSEDLAGRLGGEEFGVFLSNVDSQRAKIIANRLRLKVQAAGLELGIEGLRLSVSVGIALHRPGITLPQLMSEADQCLYAAKDAGRNTVIVSDVMDAVA